ncbi:MAG: GNAT family N-acetyltransferase [Deltaproteobacteria bacterium]|nr:GNAT family N-acetyltransferase [Deltaproteobacteria bacterium]
MRVELREITRDNLSAVLDLEVAPHQKGFVATNAVSIAQAHFYPDNAWFRAVYADDAAVGFAMLALEDDKPVTLWRFMIDHRHQGRGLGRQAIARILEAARALRPDDTELRLSHVEGAGDPGAFYTRLGFAYTGEVDDGERVMRIALGPTGA